MYVVRECTHTCILYVVLRVMYIHVCMYACIDVCAIVRMRVFTHVDYICENVLYIGKVLPLLYLPE